MQRSSTVRHLFGLGLLWIALTQSPSPVWAQAGPAAAGQPEAPARETPRSPVAEPAPAAPAEGEPISPPAASAPAEAAASEVAAPPSRVEPMSRPDDAEAQARQEALRIERLKLHEAGKKRTIFLAVGGGLLTLSYVPALVVGILHATSSYPSVWGDAAIPVVGPLLVLNSKPPSNNNLLGPIEYVMAGFLVVDSLTQVGGLVVLAVGAGKAYAYAQQKKRVAQLVLRATPGGVVAIGQF